MEDWQCYRYDRVRQWPRDDRRWYVYRMWNRDYELLYVGSTSWLWVRMRDHRAKERWPYWLTRWVDICEVAGREEALAAELYWYDRLSPVFNQLRPPDLARRVTRIGG